MTKIIGISAFFHDSAVCLIENGEIKFAAQEERFTRIKHDFNFPKLALIELLKYNNLKIDSVDFIVFFEKPFLKFERLIETYLGFAPYGFKQFLKSMPIWLNEKLFMKRMLCNHLKEFSKNFNEKKILFSEHHLSHAASAFFPSPFEKALVLTADGVGEWTTTSVCIGNKNKINFLKEIHFPNSIGLLYSAFTYYIGFKVNSGEYKLMGLAPYGKPRFADKIKENLIDIKDDGSFRLNQDYFDYSTGFRMTNKKFDLLFNEIPRKPESKIKEFHKDIAASIQIVTEELMIKILKNLKKEYSYENLCLAGGVALNCVANGKIKKEKIFKNIWIQPAAGDAGGAIGSALAVWYMFFKKRRIINKDDSMKGGFLGPNYKREEIIKSLNILGANYDDLNINKIITKTATAISKGKAVGWFQGKMEFGPRSLGSRSILADPRNKSMQKNLNLKIKYRESFRPFAPSVLEEDVSLWFEFGDKSPYMLFVANVESSKVVKKISNEKKNDINAVRSLIPAVTHIDNSARIQTVSKKTNRIFYKLISKFKDISKVPILINTSFNIRGEPIVCSPEDAFKCFMGTNLDVLVIENFFLEKKKQNPNLIKDYKENFDLD